MSIETSIEHLRDFEVFSDLDVHFAKLMANLSNQTNEALMMGAALASHFTSLGSSCVNLEHLANQSFPLFAHEGINTLSCPPLSDWLNNLQNCSVVGQAGDYTPLILDKHRLYLYRYFYYEQQLATLIRTLSQTPVQNINLKILEEGLNRLFPNTTNDDSQQKAARTAVLHHFCIISGGPGTGKTAIIIKILILLLEQNPNLNIALAAPTGKAAIRLQEAIKQTLTSLKCAPTIKAAIPQETYTIHRLLGRRATPPYYRKAGNPLFYNVIIVDEASMIDLALMTQLVQAIPKSARLILLGDKDQLTSVEAGTVLGDICEAGTKSGKGQKVGDKSDKETLAPNHLQLTNDNVQSLQNSLVFLNKNYRFSQDSGIWALAQAVKQGQSEKALQILQSADYPDVNWYSLKKGERLPTTLLNQILTNFSHCLENTSPPEVLQKLGTFKILCANRQGPNGVIQINRQIEKELSKKGLIQTHVHSYHGRPIMVTRNDYQLALFNGDVGIILKNIENNQLQAFFPAYDEPFRTFLLYRLPEHETAYAMTIHKSQGSEFNEVFILLPDQLSPLLTRELIYTGITRARQKVKIWGNEQIFLTACSEKINRSSGLRDQLM
jgi:exodeoxyribonuclease V alpha subunit